MHIYVLNLIFSSHQTVQPKLPLAKCRRNVENFLEACRRIGVEQVMMIDVVLLVIM